MFTTHSGKLQVVPETECSTSHAKQVLYHGITPPAEGKHFWLFLQRSHIN